MKYKLTPHEMALKTINDIKKKRNNEELGRKQASMYMFENMQKVQSKLRRH